MDPYLAPRSGGGNLLPTPSASKSYVVEVHVSLLPVGIDFCRFKAWPENHVCFYYYGYRLVAPLL